MGSWNVNAPMGPRKNALVGYVKIKAAWVEFRSLLIML